MLENLRPCPICGKQPKCRRHYDDYLGLIVTIQCKPLLKKAHLKAVASDPLHRDALEAAAEKWNLLSRLQSDVESLEMLTKYYADKIRSCEERGFKVPYYYQYALEKLMEELKNDDGCNN